ncbi:MAG: hypothetical protein JST89_16440 [Cyanobacteria bacterium SZAS-4]|nr:hypothetical protein [Cyanobacteria bacterium SZAS-4]
MQMTAHELAEVKAENKQLKQCIEFILEECRMVLPGIQALFGFQLISVFNERFSHLISADKVTHLAAIFFTVAAVGLLMGPASYHRLTSPRSVPPELCTVGTRLVCGGMAALMFSITLDIYLVTKIILESATAGIICGGIAFVFFSAVWFIFPVLSRRGSRQHDHGDSSTQLNL